MASAGAVSGRLAIIAGHGRLPHDVALAARKAGEDPFIIVLKNEADRDWADFEHCPIGTGDLAQLRKVLKDKSIDRVVMSGGVRRRPDWRDLRPTLKHLARLPAVVKVLLSGGDDTVLRMVITLIEESGCRVIGAQDVAPDLLAETGALTKAGPTAADRQDIEIAREAALALGALDVGQGAVVIGGRIVALEGVEGTDAMLQRVADLRSAGRISPRKNGVLVKFCKPQQDERADLPSIGVSTVENAAAAGLAGVAVEAGRSLVLDRSGVIAAGDRLGLFVIGVTRDDMECGQ